MSKEVSTSTDNQSRYNSGSALKAGAVLAFFQIGGLLLYFLGVRILLSDFSKEQNGDYVLIQTIGIFFSAIVEGGLSSIAIREIAQYPQRADRLISTILKVRLVLFAHSAVAVLAIFLVATSLQTTIILSIWLLYIAISGKGLILRSIFEYRGRATGEVLPLSVAAFADVVLFTILLYFFPKPLTVEKVAWTYLISSIPGFLYLSVRHNEWKTWKVPFSKNVALYLWREVLPVMLPFLALQGAARVHVILLEYFHGRASVGVFGAALNVISPIITLTAAVITAIFPVISAGDKHDKERARLYIAGGAKVGFFIPVLLAALSTILVKEIIFVLSNGRYAEDEWTFIATFWYAPFEAMFSYFMFMNMAISRQKRNYVSVGIYTILSIIIGIFVVPFFAETGAVLARTTALAIACAYALWTMKDYLLHKMTLSLSNSIAIMFVVLLVVSMSVYKMQFSPFLSAILLIIASPLLLIVVLNSPEKNMLFTTIQQVLQKFKKK